jgi:hypothetical protein
MEPSKLFGQTPRTSIGMSIPSEMIMPAILPGVEAPPGGNQVRVDVQIFLQALATKFRDRIGLFNNCLSKR